MALNFLKNLYKKVTTDPTPANNLSPEAQARLLNAQTPTAATAKPAASSGSTSSVAGYYRIGNDVYDPQGNYISYTQAQQKGIVPLLAGIPQKTTPATPVIPQAPLAPTDLEKYYKGIASPEKLTAEGDTLAAAQAAETKAREAATTGMENLLEQSQGLFDKLFNSADITAARVGRDQAKTELAAIDKEELDAINSVKGKITPSWAMAGQMKIIQDSYAGRRSSAAAKYEIANNNYTEARQYASEAYDHSLNVLKLKIDFIDDTLKNAKDLLEEERVQYSNLATQAKDYYKIQKDSADEHNDLFIKLATAGVPVTPDMTIDQMNKAAGPVLTRMAQQDREIKLTENSKFVDNYASDLLEGNIPVSSVPQDIRGEVIARKNQLQKEGSTEELKTTIQQNAQQGDYGTREELITALTDYYKGILTKDEVSKWVYELIPDVQAGGGSNGGIINSISNWLFR